MIYRFIFVLFVTLSIYTSAAGQVVWENLPQTLEPRVEAPALLVDDKFFIFGGFQTTDIVPTSTTEVFDFSTRQWTPFSSLPYPVTHSGMALVDKKIWIVGGFALIGFTQNIATANIYDTETDQWSEGPPLPAVRASGTLTLLGRKLHFFGGLKNRNDDVGDHYVLDVDDPNGTWQTAAPLPFPRNHLSSAAVGGKIYAIGGQFFHDVGRVDQVYMHEYDPSTDTWTRKADLPTVRSHYEASTFVEDGRIIIVGGRADPMNAVDYITAYDAVKDEWAELFSMEEPLIGPSARLYKDTLFISHGATPNVRYPQSSFRKTPFPRNPSDTLGFWPDLITFSPEDDSTLEATSILWTFTDTASYSIDLSDLPAWISTVAGDEGNAPISGAEVRFTLDATGLEPGIYTHTLTATTANYQPAEINVQIEIQEAPVLVEQSLSAGWNLIGLPLSLPESLYTEVFDTIIPASPPYGFSGGYFQSDTLVSGAAYWLKVDSTGVQANTGYPIELLSLELTNGWNMIAPPSCTLPVSLIQDPEDIIIEGSIFSFNPESGYQPADSLEAGKGYWIKTTEEGNITLDCLDPSGSIAAEKTNPTGPGREDKIYFLDAKRQKMALSLDEPYLPSIAPPVAPWDILDIRNAPLQSPENGHVVSILNGSFPIQLIAGEKELLVHTPIRTHIKLNPGDAITLSEEEKTLQVRLIDSSYPVKSLHVQSVFPYPIRKRAWMDVMLPENASSMELIVFDVQGRQVYKQSFENLATGSEQHILFETATWPAGLYLYTLTSAKQSLRGTLVVLD